MFTPTIIKILKYLRDSKERRTVEELAIIIDESPDYVTKALEKMIAVDLVAQEEGAYLYNDTYQNNHFTERLMKLNEIVSRKPSKELLIRGVICQCPSQYLFHLPILVEILEKEGIDAQELDQFLKQEIANNYLKMIRVAFLRNEVSVVPTCMPPSYFHYLSQLGIIDNDKYNNLKRNHSACEFQEEDYLIAQYPLQLVNQAKDYLERERIELISSLRRMGLVEWSWPKWGK